jgi:hypothetical protein
LAVDAENVPEVAAPIYCGSTGKSAFEGEGTVAVAAVMLLEQQRDHAAAVSESL